MNAGKSVPEYHEKLLEFVENDCAGKQYDSCVNSPCPYASYAEGIPMSDLFKDTAFKELMKTELEIETKSRVVIDYFVEIDDEQYDALDLIATLGNICEDDVYITNIKMGMMLLRYGVIDSVGSRYSGAGRGENFSEFYDYLVKLVGEKKHDTN